MEINIKALIFTWILGIPICYFALQIPIVRESANFVTAFLLGMLTSIIVIFAIEWWKERRE